MLGIRLLAILVILISGCSTRTYDVAHQNLSDKTIFVKKGVWATEIRGGGFISGYRQRALFPSQKIISGITGEIPENIGVVWVNSEEKTIEEYIPLNKKKLPILNSGDSYKFVITLNQEYIYQFEVVVIPEGAPRRKKRKAMLYCVNGEGNCEYLTPFTTNTYFDPEKLTQPQKENLRKIKEIAEKMRGESQ